MIDPLKLARACQALYGDNAAVTFDRLWNVNGTIAAHTKTDGVDVFVFRGSKTVGDWIDDVMVAPVRDPRIGWVHAGFFDGVSAVADDVALMAGVDLSTAVVTGHSLGGARARLFAGLCAHAGTPVDCCVFASPKPSYGGNLRRLIEKSGREHRSYANLNDDVVLFPPAPWWMHTEEAIRIEVHAATDDRDFFRNHHLEMYVDGIEAIDRPVAA